MLFIHATKTELIVFINKGRFLDYFLRSGWPLNHLTFYGLTECPYVITIHSESARVADRRVSLRQ